MPVRKIRNFFFFLCFISFRGYSQHAEQYSFTHYGLGEGLASNIVNNIVQDGQGFIWLSTNNGLQRFDGNKFITFLSKAGNPAHLPSDEINKLYQDRHNNLWVLTSDNRIGIFDTKTFIYKEVPVEKPRTERLYVDKNLVETADGKLLLHFRKTKMLFEFNPAKNVFSPSREVPFPPYWDVNHFFRDPSTNKYFIATDSGLVVYNPKTRNLSHPRANRDNETVIDRCSAERFINYSFIDSKKRLFFEQWPKSNIHPSFQVFDMVTGKKEQHDFTQEYGLGYHQIKAVLEQQNGKLWIYGLPFLAEYIAGTNRLQFLKRDYNKEKDLKFNQVHSMYEDRQRNMWVCTDNGVYLFNPDAQFFHNYTLTTPKRFSVEGRSQTALQLANGEIWVGYRDLGLHRYDRNINALPLPSSIQPLQENRSVWDIHQHSKTGTIWITMQGGSLIVYDTATRKAQLLMPPPFERRAITQVTEDREGNLWFGTQAGNVVKWSMDRGAKNVADGFTLFMRTGIIEKLMTDRRGHIWIAAIGAGVMAIDPQTGQIVRQISKDNKIGYALWNNNPKDIIQYNDSLLVIASGALNLVNINNYKVQQISNADGLPTNTVQSVVKDAEGALWLGTMNGLCVADIDKLQFTVYNQSDGC
jgi:ligand-binding sensor domain-containing protein